MSDDKMKQTKSPTFFGIVQEAVNQQPSPLQNQQSSTGNIDCTHISAECRPGAPPTDPSLAPAGYPPPLSQQTTEAQSQHGDQAGADSAAVEVQTPSNGAARQRFKKAYKAIHNNTLEFLGLSENWVDTHQDQWTNQRLRLAGRQCQDVTAGAHLEQQKANLKAYRRAVRRVIRQQSQESERRNRCFNDQTDSFVEEEREGDHVAQNRASRVSGLVGFGAPVQQEEEEESSTSEDESEEEPEKASVVVITWLAVSKAATKWRGGATKRQSSQDESASLPLRDIALTDTRLSKQIIPSDAPYPGKGTPLMLLGIPPSEIPPLHDALMPQDMPDNKQWAAEAVIKNRNKIQAKPRTGLRAWLGGLQRKINDDHTDSRPYFTCWVTTVHIAVLMLSMLLFPWAPYGYGLKTITGEVLTTSLSLELIEYEEPASLWVGPCQAALVALGAKFTPCMRRDATVEEGILRQREVEATTGCCVREDQSGCVQTTEDHCSERLSQWHRWSAASPGPDQRRSGPVCGQDPRFCTAPASVSPSVWPDDITAWPLCLQSNVTANTSRRDTSYTCELVGRPCCVGIHGECHITTRQHCDLLHGTFHDDAALCSQVHCLSDVCKMLAFLNPDVPDQFYRLLVSLFIHAGLLPFVLTLVLHVVYLRNLEKFAGTIRVTIIYIVSGIAGNLASAVFVPYRPEVGPAGSLAGIIGCLFLIFIVDLKEHLRSNLRVTIEWTLFLIICFILGLFPGVDNFANIFGFLMGVLLSAGLLPHIGHTACRKPCDGLPRYAVNELDGKEAAFMANAPDVLPGYFVNEVAAPCYAPNNSVRCRASKKCRLIVVLVSLLSAVALLVVLFLLLYFVPIQCDWCGYLDCIPITEDFCSQQQTSFERHKIIT